MKYSTISQRLSLKYRKNFTTYCTYIHGQGLLQNYRMLPAYRRNPSLKDYLVRAQIPPLQGKEEGDQTDSQNSGLALTLTPRRELP